MTALVLDAGALIAIDRGDRAMTARLSRAALRGLPIRTSAIVVAQVWRDSGGRQALLARLLSSVDVVPVDEIMGRAAGVLLGRAGTNDPIDGTIVLIAEDGDDIITSDPNDINRLVMATGRRIRIVAC